MRKRSAIVDAWAVGAGSLMYVAFEALQVPKRWSFPTIGSVVALYALILVRRGSDSWRDLGFRSDNLRPALLPYGGATLVACFCIVAWAVLSGRAHWDREVLILIALYPAWALVQQAVFQGVLHRRLMVLLRSPALQILIPASAFAAVHAGNARLVGTTFSAGVLWSLLYRKWPNLWLLGASHTILAALAYPLVLGDAPLSRL